MFVLFQCMICLRVPQASLESLFAAGLKIPRSCRSVLWTAVLASSPLCILKAKSSPGLHYHWHPELFVACHLLCSHPHRLHGKMATKSAEPAKPQTRHWKAGLHRQSWALQECLHLLLVLSGFAGDQQDCLFKGNLDSHSTRYLLLPDCQPSQDTSEVTCM